MPIAIQKGNAASTCEALVVESFLGFVNGGFCNNYYGYSFAKEEKFTRKKQELEETDSTVAPGTNEIKSSNSTT